MKKTEDQIQIKILGLLEINASGKMSVFFASIILMTWQMLSDAGWLFNWSIAFSLYINGSSRLAVVLDSAKLPI